MASSVSRSMASCRGKEGKMASSLKKSALQRMTVDQKDAVCNLAMCISVVYVGPVYFRVKEEKKVSFDCFQKCSMQ